MKAATKQKNMITARCGISIHAAREGGDPLAFKLRVRLKISIHAAREGGDHRKLAVDVAGRRDFNPRRP